MQSNTNDRPVAVVVGTTGAQGGAVARALLADGGWAVSQSFPAAAERAAEFDFYKRYTGTRLSDLAECARLDGSMQSFAQLMTAHGEALLPSAVRAA